MKIKDIDVATAQKIVNHWAKTTDQYRVLHSSASRVWNGNSFFDKFYKVQNFFPYAIPIVLDNEPPRM